MDPQFPFSRRALLRGAAVGVPMATLSGSAVAQTGSRPPASAWLHASQFGAVGDGAADDTDALAALLSAMQATGRPGLLGGSGAETVYSIRTGVLAWTFDNSGSVSGPGPAGPILHTAGRVVLAARPGAADAPFLSIHNDPRHGGRFVHGGSIGPLVFDDPTGDRAPNRHGLELYGVEAMVFGALSSTRLKGDLVHVSARGDPLTGDGWHVFQCVFESLTTWGTEGWTLNNDSLSQFFNFNEIGALWNMGGRKGLWRGAGASNWCRSASVGNCEGWAIDWASHQGHVHGNVIEGLELDGPEFGVCVEGMTGFRLGNVRVVHRYRENGAQVADAAHAWPKRSLSIGGRSRRAVADGSVFVFHYLKPGLAAPGVQRLGTLVDLNDDPEIVRLRIDNTIIAVGAGVAPDEARFLANASLNPRDVDIRFNGKSFLKTSNCNVLIAGAAAGALARTAYARLAFPAVVIDQGRNYNAVDGTYLVPASGLYRIAAQVTVSAAPRAEVALAIQIVGGALLHEFRTFARGGVESVRVDCLHPLVRGDRLCVVGYASDGAALAPAGIDIPSNNYFEVQLI